MLDISLTSNRSHCQLKSSSVIRNPIACKAAVEATVFLICAAYLQDGFEEGQTSLGDRFLVDGDAGSVAQGSFISFSDPFNGELVLVEGHTCKKHRAASIHSCIIGANDYADFWN